MSKPDLEALTVAITRLGQHCPTDDPVFQQVVDTSVLMAEAFLDDLDESEMATIQKLRSLRA